MDGFEEVCLDLLDAGRRGRIFDEALGRLGLRSQNSFVAELVDTYRNHRPNIALAPDAKRYLDARPALCRGALVTDGPARTQEAKIRALGLDAALDCIVCTDRLGPGCGKPHPRAFEVVEVWAEAYGAPLVYVSDNPLKDFVTPKARGWRTVQIRRPQRIHRFDAPDERHAAHASITNLDELDGCVRRLLA